MDEVTKGLSKIQRKLLKKNIISIEGQITIDTFNYVRKAFTVLLARGNPDVVMALTTTGGDAGPGMMIHGLCQLYQGKIAGLAVGYCHSMGSVILQGCGRRLAMKYSKISSHFISRHISTAVLANPDENGKVFKEAQLRVEEMIVFYRKTGKTDEEIKKFLTEDKTLSADEALSDGVVDAVIETMEEITSDTSKK